MRLVPSYPVTEFRKLNVGEKGVNIHATAESICGQDCPPALINHATLNVSLGCFQAFRSLTFGTRLRTIAVIYFGYGA